VLEIRNIQKRFGSQIALQSVDLKIQKGEFFSLLGPSGCGKSTLLRILAGLDEASAGEILWNGRRIDQLPARERPFNMVFQKYALFPHLSVEENVAFGLKLKKMSSSETTSRVREALELVNLKGFERRYPETLSGGQQQRVALARALVNHPQCLLLDEPLTALDQKLREHMQSELRLLQRRLGLTFIFVTHDQEEAMLLSDRIAVMNNGQVEQVSSPKDLYETPSSIFCARFIGRRNEINAQVVAQLVDTSSDFVSFDFAGSNGLRGRSVAGLHPILADGPAQAFIRPERLRVLARHALPTPGFNVLNGEVIQVLFRGIRSEVILAMPGDVYLRSLMDFESGTQIHVGDRVGVEFSPEETHVFGRERDREREQGRAQ
jgi:spermidine/putrescine transport system ATP-binding protein